MPLIGRRIAAFAAVALIAAGVLSGCVGQDPKPASTPEASATPLYPSEKEALAAAKVAYAKYVEVSNEIGQAGWVDLSPLDSVTTGDALSAARRTGIKFRTDGLRMTGNLSGDIIRIQQITSPSVTAYACLDVSQTKFIDASGIDQTSTDRVPVAALEVRFTKGESGLVLERSDPWSGNSFCS